MPTPPARVALGRVASLMQAAQAHGWGWLSGAEQARLARLKTPLRRAQFVSGRWLLRQTLVALYGGDALQWALSAPDQGPPQVLDRPADSPGRPGIHLGLSHSGDHVACVVAAVALGIDLEAPHRARDITGLTRLICTPGEHARLTAAAGVAQDADFYGLWTLKEAWIKLHAGELSPARMSGIDTRRASLQQMANAQLWHWSGLTLALVGDQGLPMVSGVPPECGASEAWCVDEARAPR